VGRKSRVRLLLLLDFLAFYFVQPAQALLNSTPQLLARDRRAVAQGARFGPADLMGCEPGSQSDPGKIKTELERHLCQTCLTLLTLVAHLAGQASRFLTLGRSCMRFKCVVVIVSRQTLLIPQAQFSLDFGE
jgi:hypothetical protein